MKIAIEGMDGVGKTTLAKRLAKEYNFEYIEKPLMDFFEIDNIDTKEIYGSFCDKLYQFNSEIPKAWFFGLGNVYTFLKYKDKNIIIDRHFASNYFWNGTEETNCIFKTMIDLIGVPDLTIVLNASIETRNNRLKNRDTLDKDIYDPEKQVLGSDKMINFLEDFHIPYVLVDTEEKTKDEIFNEVKLIIDRLQENVEFKTLQYGLSRVRKLEGEGKNGNIKSSK